MSGFDRIHGPRDEDAPQAGARARRALFTQTQQEHLSFVCSRCGTATPVTPRSVAQVMARMPVMLVWREKPVHGVCPACRHRAWMEITRALVPVPTEGA